MLMFLTILLASVPVLVLACVLFAAAARQQEKAPPHDPPRAARTISAPRFFAVSRADRLAESRFPADALIRQIERHVRLEQAAAESFLDAPTEDLLRSGTSSPFLN